MTYEPCTYKRRVDYRTQWFEQKLPPLLPFIENFVSEAVLRCIGKDHKFKIAYCIDDKSKDPQANLSGGYNNCIFLAAPSADPEETYNVIFRFPHPDRKYAREAYRHETAVLSHLHQSTTIPAPRIIQSGYSKVLGLPYMVMETLSGTRLDGLTNGGGWEQMTLESREYIISQLGDIINQLMHLEFDKIGSLAVLGKLAGEERRYNIGVAQRPITHHIENAMTYGRCSFDNIMPREKTFNSCEDYCEALMQIHWQIFNDQEHLVHECYDVFGDKSVYRAFNVRQALQQELPAFHARNKQADTVYRLQHPDFRAGNILVDPDTFEITGILDWESAIIIPLSLYRLPTFSSVGRDWQTDSDWYEKASLVWDCMLRKVVASPNFDYQSFFSDRSRKDYLISHAIQNIGRVVSIAEKSQLFPEIDLWSESHLSTKERPRIMQKIKVVRKYDQLLRSKYRLDQLQALYRDEDVDLNLKRSAGTTMGLRYSIRKKRASTI